MPEANLFEECRRLMLREGTWLCEGPVDEGLRLKSEKLFEDSRIESKTLLRDDFNFVSVGVMRIDE